jgi:two-component system, sensor histidine kinase RegB
MNDAVAVSGGGGSVRLKLRSSETPEPAEPLPPPIAVASNGRAPPGPSASLRQLVILRTIALCGQALAIVVSSGQGVALPILPMAAVVVSLVALNGVTLLRLTHPAPVRHVEVARHILYDLAAFTVLLYLSGGSTNPFSLIYVLHVVVIALLLPPLLAGAATLLVVGSYSLVARFHLPLRLVDGDALSPAFLAFGHWLSMALSAAVIAWFVSRVVIALREHERLLREAAQKALNDEAILKLGALAAGAAHELTTPMSTMAVVAGEMARATSEPALRRDIGILTAQIEACRQTISNLLAAAHHSRAEGGGRERLDTFLHGIAARFKAMRPDIAFTSQWEGSRPVPQIFAEQALKQSILVLLNNAADASPHDVRMTGRWNDDALRVVIEDRGNGVAPDDLGKLGRVFFTTKCPGKGTGLGLVLAANAVKSLGGTLSFAPRPGSGTCASIELPLSVLRLPEANP